jgi:hypothetical protein
MLRTSVLIHRGPAPAGHLDFSPAVEAGSDFPVLDDHWNAAPAVGQLQHPFETGIVFEHIDIFEGNLAPGEIRTGSRSVLSKILSKNDDFFVHR